MYRFAHESLIQIETVIVDGAHATGEYNSHLTIPANAIIVGVVEDVSALVGTTDNTGTMTLLLGSAGTAITADNAMPTAGVTEVNISSTNIPTKLTLAKDLVVSIGTRAMTSGRVKYLVQYVMGL
jgi:hypothetical protein